MHDVALLIEIAMALVVAFIGGIIARRIGLPTIIGYLLAGIVIGPFTPGFVGDTHTIQQLAELGVILLMFGVGLHFSLNDLWKVRAVAIPGALGQMTLATLLGFAISQAWGWTPTAGLVLGLAISVASTVVLLRGLMDNGLLNTPEGQAAIGWLILEDLATVLILVLMPTLASQSGGFDWAQLGLTLLKAAGFAVLVLLAGTRLIPWILLRVAHTRSRELFILAVMTIALGTAVGAAQVFGVSLALGAFIAGVVVSESPLSHQAGADVLPFREVFATLFFVSVGMLVNPGYVFANWVTVLGLTALVVVGKPIITLLLGLIFPWPARTTIVVALALSQIGEFSFILGQAGVSLGLLNQDQYSLILAVALITITLNPALLRLQAPLEKMLRRIPPVWKRLDRASPAPLALTEAGQPENGHVVLVGYGRVGHQIAGLLRGISIPIVVVHADAAQVDELKRQGIPGLFGDAANSEVLTHAHLDRARALVVAGPDESASALVVGTARGLAPDLPIVARAATREGVKRLGDLGAQDVIHPELEGGLELLRHTLLRLGFPLREIHEYTDAVRRDHYDLQIDTEEEHRLLDRLIDTLPGIDVAWLSVPTGSPVAGQSLAEANLRARAGASVVAIQRGKTLMANPKSVTVFQAGDRIALIGDAEQIETAARLMAPGS